MSISIGQSFALGENGYSIFRTWEAKGSTSGRVGLHRVTGEAMAFDEHFIDFVNRLPAVAGRMARPERRPELRTFAFSRLTRQRARRLAWRGRSSSASLRAWSLRVSRSALTRPSGGGAGTAAGWGDGHRAATRGSLPKKWMRGGFRVNFSRCWRSSAKFFRGSKSWNEGNRYPPPFPIWPRRHRT